MDQFNEHFQLPSEEEENESVNLKECKEGIALYINSIDYPQNSSLTGLNEQFTDDNQGLPSNKENDEEKINQSNEQVTSISKNKNSHIGKKTIIDLNGAKTKYQTNETKSTGKKKKNSRRENKINSAGAGCLGEIHKYLNYICGQYNLDLIRPNFQHLFGGNILYHQQFIKARIYQIFSHNNRENHQVINEVINQKNKNFNYTINLTFEYIYKKYIEEKEENEMSIDENEENEEKGIRNLKQVVKERREALEKKKIFSKEEFEKIEDFEYNSKNFFIELKKIKKRINCQEPKFHFEVDPYIENLN